MAARTTAIAGNMPSDQFRCFTSPFACPMWVQASFQAARGDREQNIPSPLAGVVRNVAKS